MRLATRPVCGSELDRAWAVARRSGVFATFDQFRQHWETMPWSVRVGDRGDVCVLAPWRALTKVLAIRSLSCADSRVDEWLADAAAIGRAHGFEQLLSPFLPEAWLRPYVEAGMRIAVRLVALRAPPDRVVRLSPPLAVVLRPGSPTDIEALLALDGECFDGLWAYGRAEICQLSSEDGIVVAESASGVIGYTHCTVSGSGLTLGRLAVSPSWRRRGIGAALVAHAADHAERIGASEIALCTQEHNVASRSLYVSSGFDELQGRYALAQVGICEGGELC